MHHRLPDRAYPSETRRRSLDAARQSRKRVVSTITSRITPYQRLFRFLRRIRGPLKTTRTFQYLGRRALRLQLTELCLHYPDLPAAFDGYSILHLTDLHLDHIDETDRAITDFIADISADLCVITGDMRDSTRAPMAPLLRSMEAIIDAAGAADGVVGVLGNHDSVAMVDPLESLGITMLINESVTLERAGESIHLTGLDDVHKFRSDAAEAALQASPDGFSIALVHSPEIVEPAAQRHRLYLTGHTHGGQICFPGGRPILTSLKRPYRPLSRGLWAHDDMIGYTSCGLGAAGLPLRMNCPGELVRVTLRRGERKSMINGRTVAHKDHWRISSA